MPNDRYEILRDLGYSIPMDKVRKKTGLRLLNQLFGTAPKERTYSKVKASIPRNIMSNLHECDVLLRKYDPKSDNLVSFSVALQNVDIKLAYIRAGSRLKERLSTEERTKEVKRIEAELKPIETYTGKLKKRISTSKDKKLGPEKHDELRNRFKEDLTNLFDQLEKRNNELIEQLSRWHENVHQEVSNRTESSQDKILLATVDRLKQELSIELGGIRSRLHLAYDQYRKDTARALKDFKAAEVRLSEISKHILGLMMIGRRITNKLANEQLQSVQDDGLADRLRFLREKLTDRLGVARGKLQFWKEKYSSDTRVLTYEKDPALESADLLLTGLKEEDMADPELVPKLDAAIINVEGVTLTIQRMIEAAAWSWAVSTRIEVLNKRLDQKQQLATKRAEERNTLLTDSNQQKALEILKQRVLRHIDEQRAELKLAGEQVSVSPGLALSMVNAVELHISDAIVPEIDAIKTIPLAGLPLTTVVLGKPEHTEAYNRLREDFAFGPSMTLLYWQNLEQGKTRDLGSKALSEDQDFVALKGWIYDEEELSKVDDPDRVLKEKRELLDMFSAYASQGYLRAGNFLRLEKDVVALKGDIKDQQDRLPQVIATFKERRQGYVQLLREKQQPNIKDFEGPLKKDLVIADAKEAQLGQQLAALQQNVDTALAFSAGEKVVEGMLARLRKGLEKELIPQIELFAKAPSMGFQKGTLDDTMDDVEDLLVAQDSLKLMRAELEPLLTQIPKAKDEFLQRRSLQATTDRNNQPENQPQIDKALDADTDVATRLADKMLLLVQTMLGTLEGLGAQVYDNPTAAIAEIAHMRLMLSGRVVTPLLTLGRAPATGLTDKELGVFAAIVKVGRTEKLWLVNDGYQEVLAVGTSVGVGKLMDHQGELSHVDGIDVMGGSTALGLMKTGKAMWDLHKGGQKQEESNKSGDLAGQRLGEEKERRGVVDMMRESTNTSNSMLKIAKEAGTVGLGRSLKTTKGIGDTIQLAQSGYKLYRKVRQQIRSGETVMLTPRGNKWKQRVRNRRILSMIVNGIKFTLAGLGVALTIAAFVSNPAGWMALALTVAGGAVALAMKVGEKVESNTRTVREQKQQSKTIEEGSKETARLKQQMLTPEELKEIKKQVDSAKGLMNGQYNVADQVLSALSTENEQRFLEDMKAYKKAQDENQDKLLLPNAYLKRPAMEYCDAVQFVEHLLGLSVSEVTSGSGRELLLNKLLYSKV